MYKGGTITIQTSVVKESSLQLPRVHLTKNAIPKTKWEKRAWRKEYAHSWVYMF
jgi:hypothetical protein